MSSELARSLVGKLGSMPSTWAGTIDAELLEVREVLDGLLGEVATEGDDQSELCQRARDLMERMKIK